MKETLVSIAIFFKRFSFIYRLIGIGFSIYMVFSMAIPDIMFNITSGKAVEMTFDELMKTSVDNLPRYIKIIDAVVISDSYVEVRLGKENTIVETYYPVYPSASVQTELTGNGKIETGNSAKVVTDLSGKTSLLRNTDTIFSKLVIYDTRADGGRWINTKKQITDPNFIVKGKYDGEKLGESVKKRFAEAGLNVSPDAIVLNKGEKGMKTVVSMYWVVFGLFVIIFASLSFVPGSILKKWIK